MGHRLPEQLVNSLLTLVGVVAMMLTISGWLTLVVFLTLPLSFVLVGAIAKRSKKYFGNQQKALGALNGHVTEMFNGHTIVTAFGQEDRSLQTFGALNDEYYESAGRAQFSSGLIMPIMMTVLFFNFSSGLNLYYAVSNITSIPQQWFVAKERLRRLANKK